MFTYEFDQLDKMLSVAGIKHDMRYGKSELSKTDCLFYILNVADKVEVRLLDNEHEKSLENGGLDAQLLTEPYTIILKNSTAKNILGKILKNIYYIGENNDSE